MYKKLFSAALCLIFLSASAAQALPIAPEAKAVMDKLEPVYTKGNDKATLKAAEKILSTLGETDKAAKMACYMYISESRFSTGDTNGAYAALDIMRALDPQNPFYLLGRTTIKTRDGKGEEAFQECRKDARSLPEDVRKEMDMLCRATYADSRRISAHKLWQAFNANEVAAETLYKGKLIAVEGKISRIATSPLGYPEVVFATDSTGIRTVVCQFGKDARDAVARLKKGQKVTIAGICKSFTLNTQVSVDSCWIME